MHQTLNLAIKVRVLVGVPILKCYEMAECNKGNCELEENFKTRWSKEEIEKTLKEYWSHVDYKVGDWVETCNFLPGIVQKINIRFNYDPKLLKTFKSKSHEFASIFWSYLMHSAVFC